MNREKPALDWMDGHVDWNLARHTRIHRLPSASKGDIWIKREDELSSGISGAKMRKYASLLPFLANNGTEEVALIGGPNSNNLVGLLQLLKEREIRPWLFTREAADQRKQGNALFLDMLAPSGSNQVVPRDQWDKVESMAEGFACQRASSGRAIRVIPEGASMPECLPGAITLAHDLLRNERETDLLFTQAFIDSGTGMTAIGLILGLALLDENCQDRRIHITLISGNKERFEQTLQKCHSFLELELGLQIQALPQIGYLKPPSSQSFGSVKPSLFAATREIAQSEGLLMDPIYSVKHYLAMRRYLDECPIATPSLFIYNGSSLGLAGFQSKLSAPI